MGHRTYLTRKLKGENSMSGKPRGSETIKRPAWQDPDGMVKATLLEPKYPSCRVIKLETMVDFQGSLVETVRGLPPQNAPWETGSHKEPQGYEMGT